MKIAFIGTGNMGLPMARNLLRSGHEVAVWNRTRERAEPLEQDGARIAYSPNAAVDGVDVAITMLADDRAVQQVVHGSAQIAGFMPALPPGAVHLGMSTISVGLSRHLAQAHQAQGHTYVAGPVFGRPDAAAGAKLWIVAAGDGDAVERCGPIFEALARGHSVVGTDPWLANIVKVSGNFLMAAMLEALAEAITLARKSGLDARQYLDIINSALFNSPLYMNYGGAIADQKFEPAGFKLKLGLKDIKLAQDAADFMASPMPMAGLLHDHFLSAIAQGHGEIDWAGIARVVAKNAGV